MHRLQKERKKKEKNEKLKNNKDYQNFWRDFQNIGGVHICMYSTIHNPDGSLRWGRGLGEKKGQEQE